MTIGELFIELGFKADTMKLHDFMTAVGELNMASIASALGLGVLYEATHKIMNIADQTATSIWDFSKITGVSTKDTQAFANAIEKVSGTADEARSSLKNLRSDMAKVAIGEGNLRPFAMMGITVDPDSDPIEVMKKIQNFLKTTSMKPVYADMLAAEAGLSEGTIIALRNMEDLTSAMKEQEIIGEQQINTMHEFHQLNKSLQQSFATIWTDIGSLIEPVIKEIASLLHIFTSFIHSLSTSKNMLDPYIKFAENIGAWINPFKGDWSGVVNSVKLAGVGGSSTTSNDIDIHISGVTTPAEVAAEVGRKLQKMLTDRFYHQPNQER